MLNPGNTSDTTFCFLKGVKRKMDTTAITDLLATSLGTMTLEKLLTTLLTLVVCLIGIRIVGKLMTRIMDKLSWDHRVEKYIVSGVKAVLYILTALIVADSFGIPVTSLIALVLPSPLRCRMC